MGASLCPWMLQRANSQQEQFPLPAAPHQCPSTPWGPLPAHLWHSKEHFAARHLQRILWVLLSQQLVPDKSQMPQECRLCSHSVTNPHCTAPLGRQCGKCQCSQIWSPRRTVSTTHSKAGQPEPEDRVARGQHPPPEVAESCDTWQALALQGFHPLPCLWVLFSLEKESSQKKKKKSINTIAKKKQLPNYIILLGHSVPITESSWSFPEKNKRWLFTSVSPVELSRKRHQQWLHHLWDSKQLRDHLCNPNKACRGLGLLYKHCLKDLSWISIGISAPQSLWVPLSGHVGSFSCLSPGNVL